jgi:sec-independent protein translocase protein TatC
VADSVPNLISLQSYISTLIMLSFCMGVVFLLPIICFLLGKMGLLSRDMMTIYRRHAIVAILVIAAIITPTADVFTLLLVSLPIYILYEISILLVPIKKY